MVGGHGTNTRAEIGRLDAEPQAQLRPEEALALGCETSVFLEEVRKVCWDRG